MGAFLTCCLMEEHKVNSKVHGESGITGC